MGRIVTSGLILTLLCGLLGAEDQDLALTLRGRDEAGRRLPVIELMLRQRAGAWSGAVWGTAFSHVRADHLGQVAVTVADGDLVLEVDLPLRSDGWVPAAHAVFTITGRFTDDAFTGTWEGRFADRPASGQARGQLRPAWPRAIAGHRPIASEEHPRLFLRREDIPQIRAFASTALGRQVVARLDALLEEPIDYTGGYGSTGGFHAAGHAIRFLLEDDPAHAQRAGDIALRAISARLGVDHLYAHSHPALGVAMAYDLCYQAWDPVLRQEVARYLDDIGRRLVYGHSRGFNANPGSNWSARCRGSGGVALLAIDGDPLPPPARSLVVDLPLTIPPCDRGGGQPVSLGRMPQHWLVSSPVELDDAYRRRGSRLKDVAERIGFAAALPEVTSYLADDQQIRFAPLAERHLFSDDRTGSSQAIDLRAAHGERPSRVYLHTRLTIRDAGVYRLRTDLGPPVDEERGDHAWLWLNGRMIRDNAPLALSAGSYALLIGSDRPSDSPTARAFIMPRLERADDQHQRLSAWQALVAQWRADGGRAHNAYWIDSAARHSRRWLQVGAGDRAFPGEGDAYGAESIDAGVAPLALTYRNALAGDISAGESMEWILPLYALRAVPVDGRLHTGHWGRHRGTRFARLFPLVLPLSQAEHRPALVHYWLQRWGPQGDGSFGIAHPHEILYVLTSRFWQIEALPPAGRLPTSIHDSRRLYWAWRSGYDHPHGDCVVELHARGGQSAGWWAHDAGSWRLRGRGRAWAMRDDRNGLAPEDHNTIQLADWSLTGSAQLIDHHSRAGGGHLVRLDMGPAYRRDRERGSPWDQEHGDRALRCLLVNLGHDQSSALVALGDRIEGFADNPRHWQLWLPAGATVSSDAGGFTISQGDEHLQAAVQADAPWQGELIAPDGAQQQLLRLNLPPTASRILVVMALGTGHRPTLEADAIRHGQQLIRWDDDTIHRE